jgi:hypothetical protein
MAAMIIAIRSVSPCAPYWDESQAYFIMFRRGLSFVASPPKTADAMTPYRSLPVRKMSSISRSPLKCAASRASSPP